MTRLLSTSNATGFRMEMQATKQSGLTVAFMHANGLVRPQPLTFSTISF